jgi:hypothetical protein
MGMGNERQPPFALLFLGVTAAALAPTISIALVCFFCWLTEPPSFPGDPNIGLGLLCLILPFNLPFVLLAWILLAIWTRRQN